MPSQPAPPENADPEIRLFDAFLTLRTRAEVKDFLADLCTPAEVRAFAERLEVARLLVEGEMSYRQIARQAPASTSTVVRVARFLNDMPFGGYRRALERLKGAAS